MLCLGTHKVLPNQGRRSKTKVPDEPLCQVNVMGRICHVHISICHDFNAISPDHANLIEEVVELKLFLVKE